MDQLSQQLENEAEPSVPLLWLDQKQSVALRDGVAALHPVGLQELELIA